MNSILNLPPSLRITLFVFLMISFGLFIYSSFFTILAKREKVFIFHSLSFTFSILFMVVSRTPVIEIKHPEIISYISLINVIPMFASLIMFIKYKHVIHIIDALIFIFNITLFEFIPYYGYIVSGTYFYILIRAFMVFYKCNDNRKEYPGTLSIKDGLDDLSNGVIFANMFGQITYINQSLKDILFALDISSYNKIKQIYSGIKKYALYSGRIISDKDIIININDKSYRILINNDYTQLISQDISLEEKLTQKEENNKKELSIINKELENQLDKVEDIQKEKELLSIKGNIHDNLAQQLSILHSFLLIDNSKDLRELKKNLLKISDTTFINEEKSVDLDYLVDILHQIGVNLIIKGNFPSDKKKQALFIKVIKEGTTNAIKHGFAKNIVVNIKENEISITNDGLVLEDIKYGNGLNSIQKEVENLSGQLLIDTKNQFSLKIKITDQ